MRRMQGDLPVNRILVAFLSFGHHDRRAAGRVIVRGRAATSGRRHMVWWCGGHCGRGRRMEHGRHGVLLLLLLLKVRRLLMMVVVLCGRGRGRCCCRGGHVLEAPVGEMLLLLVLVVHAGSGEAQATGHSTAGHYAGWHHAVTGRGRCGRSDHCVHVLLLLLLLVYTRFIILQDRKETRTHKHHKCFNKVYANNFNNA